MVSRFDHLLARREKNRPKKKAQRLTTTVEKSSTGNQGGFSTGNGGPGPLEAMVFLQGDTQGYDGGTTEVQAQE